MDEGIRDMEYFVSWSGGKDGCLAAHRIAQDHGAPAQLLTMLDEDAARSRGHHLRPEVLRAQAAAMGTRLELRATSWEEYEDTFKDGLRALRDRRVTEGVFGDIDLLPHREWVERVCAEAGVAAHEPLWLEERRALLREFIDAGYQAMVIGVKDDVLDRTMLGRMVTDELVDEFEAAGIDASGELGEYHTVVVDGPLFRHPLQLVAGDTIPYDGYSFLDVTVGL